jgi:multiple sugar transport system substrate-binding protein
MFRRGKLAITMGIAGVLALGASATATATSSAAASPTTVTVWNWPQNSSIAVAAFEKANPGIKIDLTNVGSGATEYTKLTTALAAGSGAPCLAQIEYEELPSFLAHPGIVNIAQYASSYAKDFPSWVWKLVSKGSDVYAIPNDIGPVGFAYNAADLKKYNLPVPKTWAQFATDAVTLHKDNPKMYLTYFDSGDTFMQGLVWQAGAQEFAQNGNSWKVELDNPTAQKVLSMWGTLIKNGDIPLLQPGTPTFGKDVASGIFASYLMAAWDPTYLGSFMTGAVQHLTLTSLPQWSTTGAPRSFDYGGSTLAVTNQCKDPAAAVKFATWEFTTKPGLTVTQGNGNVKPGQPGAGEGLFDAALARSTVSAFNQPNPSFAQQKNAFYLFNTFANQVKLGFVWSPFESYVGEEWGTLATEVGSNKLTFASALSQIQSKTVSYAKQQGYSVSG